MEANVRTNEQYNQNVFKLIVLIGGPILVLVFVLIFVRWVSNSDTAENALGLEVRPTETNTIVDLMSAEAHCKCCANPACTHWVMTPRTQCADCID